MTNKEKFLKLVEPYDIIKHGRLMREVRWRVENRELLRAERRLIISRHEFELSEEILKDLVVIMKIK